MAKPSSEDGIRHLRIRIPETLANQVDHLKVDSRENWSELLSEGLRLVLTQRGHQPAG